MGYYFPMIDKNKLKKIRESKDLSTRELARRAQISTQTVHALEHTDQQPSVRTLAKIARALGVEVKDFF